jgi:hypothetical protein
MASTIQKTINDSPTTAVGELKSRVHARLGAGEVRTASGTTLGSIEDMGLPHTDPWVEQHVPEVTEELREDRDEYRDQGGSLERGDVTEHA